MIDQTAHLLGNYHKYYTFHTVESRIGLLQTKQLFLSLWRSFHEPSLFTYLDIGCNEGDLTYSIYQLIRSELPSSVRIVVVGVDIDGELISLAREKYHPPSSSASSSKQKNAEPERKNEIQDDAKEKSSVSDQTTGLEAKEEKKESSGNNDQIYFENIDFTNLQMIASFREKLLNEYQLPLTAFFNLISVFSTTMWIHINHGDDGLKQFFLNVQSFLVSKERSALLVEPQPSKCYTSAARRCRKLRISYPPFLEKINRGEVLTLLHNIIDKDLGLDGSHCFGEEDWGRPLTVYYEKNLTIEFTES